MEINTVLQSDTQTVNKDSSPTPDRTLTWAEYDFIRFLIRIYEAHERRQAGEWVEAGREV